MRRIGNINLSNPFVAAPLAGITDVAARTIYKEMGASLVFSEMISAKGLLYQNKNTEQLLTINPEEKPIAYQLFGREPEILGQAAEMLAQRENQILDINMGCPVPKVVKNGEGSALLKEPDLIYQLVKATVAKAGKPVTVKIRIGWDKENMVAVEVAKAIEAAGGAAVTVHGRYREQYYTGKADRKAIAQVKKAVSIPVIGNGDVFSGQDAIDLMEETGCDMVMIARGMLGNPWIFREALALWKGEPKPEPATRQEKADMIKYHFSLLMAAKGEKVAIREMRKHFGWYLKGEPNGAALRRKANEINQVSHLEQLVDQIKG